MAHPLFITEDNEDTNCPFCKSDDIESLYEVSCDHVLYLCSKCSRQYVIQFINL
jgi:transposase-like protein